jgi:hypothetical protein
MALTPQHNLPDDSDPQERVKLLEQTLPDKDWRVTLRYPAEQIGAAKAEFESRGYLVRQSEDAEQQPILHVHHLGGDTPIRDIMRAKGTLGGTGYLISNPGFALGHAASGTKAAFSRAGHALRDPARLNGFIFLAAEGFLATAGMFNKKTPLPDSLKATRRTANLLQTIAGGLFLSQSFTYLFLARPNDDLAVASVRKKMDTNAQNGKPMDDMQFDASRDSEKPGLAREATRLIRKYPIQLGALFNDLGMMFYIGHVFKQRSLMKSVSLMPGVEAQVAKEAAHYVKTGWKFGAIGSSISLVGWTLMLLPRKQLAEDKQPHSLWEKLRANPQHVAGVLAVGSSSLRLTESLSLGKRNYVQAIGEAIYVPGDILLMFTKNDHYGDGNKNSDAIAQKIAEHIRTRSTVLGPQAELQLAENISRYLHTKAEADKDDTVPHGEPEIAELAEHIRRALQATKQSPFDQLAQATAHVLEHFPGEERAAINQVLGKTLSTMPWLKATPEEIVNANERYMTAATGGARPVIQPLNEELAAIATVAPGSNPATTVLALQRALTPFLSHADRVQVSAAVPAHAGRV